MHTNTRIHVHSPFQREWSQAFQQLERKSLLEQLPYDVFQLIVLQHGNASLNSLMRSSKILYLNAFTTIAKLPHVINDVSSKLLAMQDIEALKNFLSVCQDKIPLTDRVALDLHLCYPVERVLWKDLPAALTYLQAFAPINSITFQGRNWGASDIASCLHAVPSLKVVDFISIGELDFEQLLDCICLQNANELHCVDVTCENSLNDDASDYSLARILQICPKLQQLTFTNCDQLIIDMRESLCSDNLQFFSYKRYRIYGATNGNLEPIVPAYSVKFEETPSPRSGLDYYLLACKHLDRGFEEYDLVKAKDFLRESIQKSPQLANPKALLGKLLAEEENPASWHEAQKLLEESLKIVPAYPLAQVGCGILLFRDEKDEEAYTLLEQVAKRCMYENNIDLLVEIAKILAPKDPTKSRPIFDYLQIHIEFFNNFATYRDTIIGDEKEFVSPDDIDVYSLYGLIDMVTAANEKEYNDALALYEKIASSCLKDGELGGALIIGCLVPDQTHLFKQIQAAVLPDFVETVKESLDSLQQSRLEDIKAWISLFTVLRQSGQDITSLLALFLKLAVTTPHINAMHKFLCEANLTEERKFFTEIGLWTRDLDTKQLIANLSSHGGNPQELRDIHGYLNYINIYSDEDARVFNYSSLDEIKLDSLPKVRAETLETIIKSQDEFSFSYYLELAELLISKSGLQFQTRKAERIFKYIIENCVSSNDLVQINRVCDSLGRYNILPEEQERLKRLLSDNNFLELLDEKWFEEV